MAKSDEMFSFVLDFVDGLPKIYNTVDIALSQTGRTDPINVVGNIISIAEPTPVQITKQDYDSGDCNLLFDKSYRFFYMSGESFNLLCAVHNVEGLARFPYGKNIDDYEKVQQNIQYAYLHGKEIHVVGRYVTLLSQRQQKRILYVDTVNVEHDSMVSKMKDSHFTRFMDLCDKAGVTPLEVFMDKIFTGHFDADEYLMKTVAVFCLSPGSRQEMIHILLLSAPGEGKDYLIDNIIQPMVRCGKVDTETTGPALAGAMSSDDLSSLGVGVLQRYHRERLAASEVQTWDAGKVRVLLGMLANGYVSIAKGKMLDQTRPACENVLLAGNISNAWKEGMSKWEKMDSFMAGKNKQFAKQMVSRMTLIYARVSLLKNPDPFKKARMIMENMDDDTAKKEGDLFVMDDVIKEYCSRTDLKQRERSRLIRERKVKLLRDVAERTDDEIIRSVSHRVWQEFFGEYFKYVSNLSIRTREALDGIYRTLMSMTKRPEFSKIICNEAGDLDPRKLAQFTNLCKAFAKIHGHKHVMAADISEAETLFKESTETLIDDFGADLLTTGLDVIELDILKYISEHGSAEERDIRKFLRADSTDRFFDNNMKSVKPYLHFVGNKYLINYDAIPDGIRTELNIRESESISERDALMRGESPDITDDDLESRLEGMNFGGVGNE
jgi:hypothetical protein